jgi:hypothetical protein
MEGTRMMERLAQMWENIHDWLFLDPMCKALNRSIRNGMDRGEYLRTMGGVVKAFGQGDKE